MPRLLSRIDVSRCVKKREKVLEFEQLCRQDNLQANSEERRLEALPHGTQPTHRLEDSRTSNPQELGIPLLSMAITAWTFVLCQ